MNSLIAPIICFIILIYCYFRFSKGNDIKLEFSTNPPNNLDSLEIAFLLRGFITDNDIVSLLLSLANTGYISFNGNKDYFTIKKEKEYKENNLVKKILMKQLFIEKEEIELKDIKYKFNTTMYEIKKLINDKNNQRMIFETKLKKYKILVIILTIISIYSVNLTGLNLKFNSSFWTIFTTVLMNIIALFIIRKDTAVPTLSSINVISPKSGTYKEGQTIKLESTYSENIYGDENKSEIISNTAPILKLKFGSGIEKIAKFGGVNGNKITYTYQIESGDKGELKTTNYSGNVYDEACAHALDLAAEHGYTFVHPFDDPTVATGQGTIAMDIFKELPTVDYILVPIGGGGLATGVSTLAKLLNPHIKVIGVEPAGAACMKASLEAGKVVSCDHVSTIADGTAVQTPGKIIFPYVQENLDDIITVEDEELIPCFLDLLENHKMLAENSGLLTIAALKHLDVKNKKVVSIISGGNMDVITIASLVQHGLIMRDRIFTVSVFLPDKPGELTRVSQVIAETQGNIVKLEHNQFVSINRNSAVELTITMEAFGSEHKNKIIKALKKAGYDPKIRNSKSVY